MLTDQVPDADQPGTFDQPHLHLFLSRLQGLLITRQGEAPVDGGSPSLRGLRSYPIYRNCWGWGVGLMNRSGILGLSFHNSDIKLDLAFHSSPKHITGVADMTKEIRAQRPK